jgi:hypothetical protein
VTSGDERLVELLRSDLLESPNAGADVRNGHKRG